jgi:drug/metabolite transporter (DMT)-like permease
MYANRLQMGQLSTTFYMVLYTIPLLAIPTLLTRQYEVGPINPIPAVALLWLAVVVTGLGYLALNIGLTAETTTLTALRLLIVPLVSTLISVTMLGEPLTAAKLGGGSLIALGILYPQLAPRLVASEVTT